jgi:hypothetical protein
VFGVELSQQPDGLGINFKNSRVHFVVLFSNDGLIFVVDDDIRIKGLDGRLFIADVIFFDLGSGKRTEQFHGGFDFISR